MMSRRHARRASPHAIVTASAAAVAALLLQLLSFALHVGPAAAASASATQTPSAPRSVAPTPSPSGTYRPGVITTLAGTGVAGFSGDGGPATSAALDHPHFVMVDGSNNVLIADTNNHRVRRVAAGTGIVTTLAGMGLAGFGGDDGPATSGMLFYPHGLALDGSGNVLISDTQNHRVRRVAAGTGVITTLAGNGFARFGGDGGPATSANLQNPVAQTFDSSGNLLIADQYNHRIRRVAAGTGIITTLAGTGSAEYGGDGGPATSAALRFPFGLAMDGGGNLLIADRVNHRIRRVTLDTGLISTVAGTGTSGFSGDGGPATNASLNMPHTVIVDDSGDMLIADTNNQRIRRVSAGSSIISTLAGTGLRNYDGDGGPAMSASIDIPIGLALDASGNLLIADVYNSRIRVVSAPTQPSPSPTPTPSTTPYCTPALFRPLPRTDLVGVLVGTALSPGQPTPVPTEAACRQACCDAAACDGYSFDASNGRQLGAGECFLLVNVSQLVPSNGYASGIRESALL